MRRIEYAGGAFYTGDAIAEALLDYARELARNSTADTVFIPAQGIDGDMRRVEVLLGPASQLLSEPMSLVGAEITDEALVERIRHLSDRLAAGRPGHDEPFIDPE
ncbi:hypothetical protein ACPPVW_06390 [Leifsonia sp. McL0607]|uniref:hypothetical protein n=1 Tax=Leifsonia sp. McL0607 TaxID=3415672 RepID=UPI003CF5A60C